MKKLKLVFLFLMASSIFFLLSCAEYGCTDPEAHNYDEDAEKGDGSCTYLRKFYASYEYNGWIDVWVEKYSLEDEPEEGNTLEYEGRIESFISDLQECEMVASDSVLFIDRAPGEYYYEYETQEGSSYGYYVEFREEACRMFKIY